MISKEDLREAIYDHFWVECMASARVPLHPSESEAERFRKYADALLQEAELHIFEVLRTSSSSTARKFVDKHSGDGG
jgi:hypothetical protein